MQPRRPSPTQIRTNETQLKMQSPIQTHINVMPPKTPSRIPTPTSETQPKTPLPIRIHINVMPPKTPLHTQTPTSETQPKTPLHTQTPTSVRLSQWRKQLLIRILIRDVTIGGVMDLVESGQVVRG